MVWDRCGRARGLFAATPPPSHWSVFCVWREHQRRLSFCRVFARFIAYVFVVLVGLGSFVHSPHWSAPFFFIHVVFVFKCDVVFVRFLLRSLFLSSLSASQTDSMSVLLQDGCRCFLLVVVFCGRVVGCSLLLLVYVVLGHK